MFKVKKEVLEAIGNYLAQRPWSEVNNLIVELQKVEFIQEEIKEELKEE